jgi:hypothetical protein
MRMDYGFLNEDTLISIEMSVVRDACTGTNNSRFTVYVNSITIFIGAVPGHFLSMILP